MKDGPRAIPLPIDPFVTNCRKEIKQALRDYNNGTPTDETKSRYPAAKG